MKLLLSLLIASGSINAFALNGPIISEKIVLNDDTKYLVSLPYECSADEFVEVSVTENSTLMVNCAQKVCILKKDSRGVVSTWGGRLRLGIYLREGVKETLLQDFKGNKASLEAEVNKLLNDKTCKKIVDERLPPPHM